MLRIRIRDPGLGAFMTPGSGIRDGRKSASGSGIRDEQPGSYFLELRNHFLLFLGLTYLNSMRIRDPGWSQFGSGMEKSRIRDINIPDPPHSELRIKPFFSKCLQILLSFHLMTMLCSAIEAKKCGYLKLSMFLSLWFNDVDSDTWFRYRIF